MTATTTLLTLNQIVAKIQDIATCHGQIREFKFLDGTWDGYSSGVTNAPELLITVADFKRGRRTSAYKFTFYILDDVERSTQNQPEVWSDTALIAEDIIAQLRSDEYGWSVDKDEDIDVQFLSEKFPRAYSGVQFDITITLYKPDDKCQIPFLTTPTTT